MILPKTLEDLLFDDELPCPGCLVYGVSDDHAPGGFDCKCIRAGWDGTAVELIPRRMSKVNKSWFYVS